MPFQHRSGRGEWHVPGFTEVCQLDTGAHGRTVLAHGKDHSASVVIRYLPAELLADQARAKAFKAQARKLARLRHPNVVRFRRYAQNPRITWSHRPIGTGAGAALVTDAVEGVSLQRLLDRTGPMPTQAALVVLRGSLYALSAAHRLGLTHGDLRPRKILIDSAGRILITGFAVAALTRGSPVYRAPERWSDDNNSPTADVYAAGCAFFACLTGQPPFPATELFSLMGYHTTTPPPVQAIPATVRPLLARSMVKDPARRPSPRALAAELAQTAFTAFGPNGVMSGRPNSVPSPSRSSAGGLLRTRYRLPRYSVTRFPTSTVALLAPTAAGF